MRAISMLAAAGLVTLTGCADLIDGTTQVVSVETRAGAQPVVGASCRLENSGGVWYLTSPGTVKVKRTHDDLAIKCELNGVSGTASVPSHLKQATLGDVVLPPGALVDAGSGAGWDYPPLITVQLGGYTQQYKSGN